jgi:multimeric flavodoxin WrbA
MNLLAINFSPRKEGHTYDYIQRVIAQLKPHQSEIINFPALNIGYCMGCLECETARRCVIEDDWQIIVDKIEKADTVIFGSPVYSWQLAAPVHVFTNRCRMYISYNEGMGFPGLSFEEARIKYYKKNPAAPHPPPFKNRIKKGRDCYIVVTQGSPDPQRFLSSLKIFSDFVQKTLLMKIKKQYIIASSSAPYGENVFEVKKNKALKSNGITA